MDTDDLFSVTLDISVDKAQGRQYWVTIFAYKFKGFCFVLRAFSCQVLKILQWATLGKAPHTGEVMRPRVLLKFVTLKVFSVDLTWEFVLWQQDHDGLSAAAGTG